ncbi:MAG: hypothetical protein JWM12_2563, partial [Ilumatobacteraceae bacterium]|nr:hypothetical protein [Ilumatobacteraceae bacterium]
MPLRIRRPHRLRAVVLIVALVCIVAGCGSNSSSATTTITLPQKVVVSSVAGDEMSTLLAALYAEALLNAGLRVVRKDPYPDWPSAYAALQSDAVQVVPGFSGDLLTYLHSIGATPATTTTPPSTVASSSTVAAQAVDDTTTTTVVLPTGDPKTVEDQVAVTRTLLP